MIAVDAPAACDVLRRLTHLPSTTGVSPSVISTMLRAAVWPFTLALRDNLCNQTLLTDLTRTDPFA